MTRDAISPRLGVHRISVLLLGSALLLAASVAEGQQVHLRVERRETVLGGKPFGSAGPYEKLIGKVDFELDPSLPANSMIVDIALAPRNARGAVQFSADFYLLKPIDAAKGNGRLFYEVVNRGEKGMLGAFQDASAPSDSGSASEFGDGWLMAQGFTLLWMGWQWDVPDGMRMEMPIASDNGRTITGLVRGNFIPGNFIPRPSSRPQPLADRGHQPYPVLDPASPENVMTVRTNRTDPPQVIPRASWRFLNGTSVTLDGGFEPGRIYDVVYRSKDPRVVGVGLAGTRDLVSFLKYDKSTDNPVSTIRSALAWGVSQSGRFLRHFLYEGFNADTQGRRVFDGVIDDKGGAGRGSFNHRFAQASRDALEHENMLYPVDVFPFTDGMETDPETGQEDGLLARAEKSGTAPKLFHILSNSEYFNRAGSLVHTDVRGERDAELPSNTRIYFLAGLPHFAAPVFMKNDDSVLAQAGQNPVDDSLVLRALFHAMDRWVTDDVAPPPSAYPKIADGTLVPREEGGWPAMPGIRLPPPQLIPYRLDFGPNWSKGIIDNEPPRIGKPYVVRVPAVDADGNDRAGIRVPEIAVPLGTYTGWNYRDARIGAPEHLAGELGSYIPFARTRAGRQENGDPRASIEERYPDKAAYFARITAVANDLAARGYLLADDVDPAISDAASHWNHAPTSISNAFFMGAESSAFSFALRWRTATLLIVLTFVAGVLFVVFRLVRAALRGLRRWRRVRSATPW